MAIGAMVAFFITVFLCGLLVWSANSRKLEPFMISIDNHTGVWSLVGHGDWVIDYSVAQTMQESVVGQYVKTWLTISENTDENIAAWGKCSREECVSGDGLLYGGRRCALYCQSGNDIYNRFIYNVMNDYTARAAAGDSWTVDTSRLEIMPAGPITDAGGTWHVHATVQSKINDDFEVEIFVKVARNMENFPATMGYYVADFNAYRIEE